MNAAEEMLSGMGVGFATERDRLRVASLLTGLLRDKECMDWLEENADEIVVLRDTWTGVKVKVKVEYCSKESGCPVEIYGRSLRDVAAEALRD